MNFEPNLMGLEAYEMRVPKNGDDYHVWSCADGFTPEFARKSCEAGFRIEMYHVGRLVSDIDEFPDAVRMTEQAVPPLRILSQREHVFIEPELRQCTGVDEDQFEAIVNPSWEDAKWEMRFAYRGKPPQFGIFQYDGRIAYQFKKGDGEILYEVFRRR